MEKKMETQKVPMAFGNPAKYLYRTHSALDILSFAQRHKENGNCCRV